jgi:hypothetical protein
MSSPVNLKTFPQLGAFSDEISSGNVAGGIGGLWIGGNEPLNYFFNFGRRTSKKSGRRSSKRKSHKASKKASRKSRKSKSRTSRTRRH